MFKYSPTIFKTLLRRVTRGTLTNISVEFSFMANWEQSFRPNANIFPGTFINEQCAVVQMEFILFEVGKSIRAISANCFLATVL